jgi:hypothetical protein
MKLISNSLSYAASAATAIAGILHLIFASNVVGSGLVRAAKDEILIIFHTTMLYFQDKADNTRRLRTYHIE